MKKEFRVETANWYKDVVLEVTETTPSRDLAMEAATQAVEDFFTGNVRVSNIDNAHTIEPVITVREKDKYTSWLYAPVVVANAGYHKEASLMREKIINHNYESETQN